MILSIVINALYQGRSFLMADSRRSDDSGFDFLILDENTPKIFKLRHNMAIGFTGGYSAASALMDDYRTNFTNVKFADELAPIMRENALRAIAACGCPVQFVLTGKCRDGTTDGFCIITAHQYALESLTADSSQGIRYVILNDHSDELSNYLCIQFQQRVKRSTQERCDRAILECLEQTIYRAAEIDRTVNTKTQLIDLWC